MSGQYVPLHVHTDYSILDGKASIPRLAERAGELGLPALSITDHGSLSGAFQLYRECQRVGIKPIIGLEAYEAPIHRADKTPTLWGKPEQKREDVGGSGKYTHLTLFARSAVGLRNLYRLYYDSFTIGFHGKPRVDTESVAHHSEGLVATSGCVGGAISTLLKLQRRELAEEKLRSYLDIFGTENFYIEVMRHNIEVEQRVEGQLLELAKKYGLKVVATLDSHYVNESDSDSHDDLLCVQTGAKKSTPREDRFSFSGDGYHLQSPSEFRARFSDLGGAVQATLGLAESIGDYSEVFDGSMKLPRVRYDAFQGQTLREVVTDGRTSEDSQAPLPKRDVRTDLPGVAVRERLDYELDIIESRGFDDYLLVCADIITEGRKRGFRYGPSRGSAAGSLVVYSLRITEIDPISHGLIFERFINPERAGFPDVDIDVAQSKRDQHIQMMKEMYGADQVIQLGTHGLVGARSAIRDAVRISDLPFTVGEDLTRLLPRAKFGREPSLDEISSDGGYPEVLRTATGLEGSVRSQGVHSAGVIIGDTPLWEVLPVHRTGAKREISVTSFDMGDVERLGLLKTDWLGLANLDVIDECVSLLQLLPEQSDKSGLQNESSGGVYIFELPRVFDDSATFELLSAGETTGIFQLESGGMRSLLQKLQPSSLLDISGVLSLFRPGPMGAGAHTKYADRKNGRSPVDFPHPEFADSLSEVLRPTYGLIVFQEQVLEVLRVVGEYTYGTAALIFDAMRKKDHEKLLSAHPDFCQRLSSGGYSDGAIQALWDTLVPFADYSFNKSHATGYAIISYWTAYLKRWHPREYFTALLTVESRSRKKDDKKDEIRIYEYIRDCVRWGIPILPPDINTSNLEWTLTDEGIRFGLSSIKGVSAATYEAVSKGRPYKSLQDYLDRVSVKGLNVGTLKALTGVGAFDELESDREGLLNSLESLSATAVNNRTLKGKSQRKLWNVYSISPGRLDVAGRQRSEVELMGHTFSYPRVSLKLTRHLDRNEVDWLMKTIGEFPGNSPVDLEISEVSKMLDIGRMDPVKAHLLKGMVGL